VVPKTPEIHKVVPRHHQVIAGTMHVCALAPVEGIDVIPVPSAYARRGLIEVLNECVNKVVVILRTYKHASKHPSATLL
jgi:hypothetical protein